MSYWNQAYVDYWKHRCEEAEKEPLDSRHPPALLVFKALFMRARPKAGEHVLDIGAGLGRMFPVYEASSLSTTGIDISDEMVTQAKANYPHIPVLVGDAVNLPFPDQAFDLVVCWGTMDTLPKQRLSLLEMVRILRTGGRLLLTGKNRVYREDDVEARIAEEKAREKGHPNTFTEYDELYRWATELHLNILHEFFFEYRGDFSEARCRLVKPKAFYEWCVVLSSPARDG